MQVEHFLDINNTPDNDDADVQDAPIIDDPLVDVDSSVAECSLHNILLQLIGPEGLLNKLKG